MQRLSSIFQHRACGSGEVLAVMRVFGENKSEVKDNGHKGGHKVLREEADLLLSEKLPFQANTKVMIVNLSYEVNKYQREIDNQWETHAQESGKMFPRRHVSASKYAKQSSELQTTQLLEKEKLVSDFQQQRGALREISLGGEKQYRELQTIQEELKKV